MNNSFEKFLHGWHEFIGGTIYTDNSIDYIFNVDNCANEMNFIFTISDKASNDKLRIYESNFLELGSPVNILGLSKYDDDKYKVAIKRFKCGRQDIIVDKIFLNVDGYKVEFI